MFGKKKINLNGFKIKEPPQRTKEQIDQDYTHNAVQAGHKSRVVLQLQSEVEQHLTRMTEINAEAMRLPPEAPKTEPAEEPKV